MSSTSPPEITPQANLKRAWYWAFVAWGAAILLLYPLLRVEDARVVLGALGERTLDVLVPLLLLALHLAPARRIVRALGCQSPSSQLLFPVGVSVALIISWSTLLAFAGLLGTPLLYAGPIIAAVVFHREYRPLAVASGEALRLAARAVRTLPGGILAAVLFLGLVMTLTPATSLDGLHYHLEVPKVWLQNGGVTDLPGNIYSRFPMNTEMLYVTALAWRGEIAAKVFHWLLGVLSAVAIARVSQRFASTSAARWSAAIFLCVPTVFRVGTWAYVELAGVFFLMLAWLVYLQLRTRELPHSAAVLCGVLAGMALGTKYTFLLPVAFLMLLLVRVGGLRLCLVAGVGVMLGGGAWYLRNLWELGNPVFPFLYSHFAGPGWDAERSALFMESLKEWGSSGLDLPFALTFQSMFGSVHRFDGIVGPVYLLALPLAIAAVARHRAARSTGLLGLLLLSSWVATTHQVRFLVPALAVLAVLIPAGWEILPEARQRRVVRGLVATALTLCLTSHLLLFSSLQPVPFVLGLESRDEHRERVLQPGDYSVFQDLNRLVPEDGCVLFAACGTPRYLIDRPYHADSVFENHSLKRLLAGCRDASEFVARFHDEGFTHLVFHAPLVLGDGSDLEPVGQELLRSALRQRATLLSRSNGTLLFAIPSVVRGDRD
ncbi:MAG: DUF1420 family protein [Planctomycetota bacterium]